MQTKEPKDPKGAKIRLFAVAKELDLPATELVEYCKELGYNSVKNQLSTLDQEQADSLKDRVKKGPKPGAAPAPAPTAKAAPLPPAALPKLDSKVKTIAAPKAPPKAAATVETAKPKPKPEPVAVVEEPPAPVVEPVATAPVAETAPEEPVAAPAPVAPTALPNINNRMPNLSNRPQGLGNRPPSLGSGNKPQVVPPRPTPVRPVAAVTPPPQVPVAPVAPVETQAEQPQPAQDINQPAAQAQRPQMGQGNSNSSQRPPQLNNQGGQRPPQRQGQGPSPRSGPPSQGGQRSGPPSQGAGPRSGPPGQGGQGQGGGPGQGQGQGGPRSNAPPPRPGPPGLGPRPLPARPGGSIKLTDEQIKKLREASSRGQRASDAVKSVINERPQAPNQGGPGGPGGPGKPGGPDRRPPTPGGPPRPAMPAAPGTPEEEDRGGDKRRPGEVSGRDSRTKGRQTGGRDRRGSTDRNSVVIEAGGKVDIVETQHGSRRGPRAALLAKMKRRQQQTVVKKEGPVEINTPITVRSLSEAIGMKAGEVILRLKKETNSLYSINSNIDFDVAELIAVDKGITLVAKKQATAEDDLFEKLKTRAEASDPANVTTRPPIVTIMGHVDHGKTSLLDKIRQIYGHKSDVVSTEAGGITQVLRAWSVQKEDKTVTFLDTPGHEAFTKMRARGANVTDIVVIVVSASDGVMPQTEEAISHALAADVDIIVAINKVDLPDANIDRTRRQLYQLNLLPDNMGGEVPFVECSAKTGVGIDELLDQIAVLSELGELTADPTLAASGTCLEAYLDKDKGVIATLLIQNGTLKKGDSLLCGATFGRVRAIYDDLGRTIESAGPSTPIKVTGLDEVPDADDGFFAVDDIGTAREIAERRENTKSEAALNKFAPVSLENLNATRAKMKITELKIILKAEARGSVEAIKKELEKLVHEEVRVRVLHAGIGAISESDVQLALTSPDDTLIIGFNVTADDNALRMAEQKGISDKIREYDIIYKLTDNVKGALEGKLKPVEEVVHLGRAIIRNTFKISKTGTIAGCYVTSGTIERSARIRVIRDGVVVYPPSEKVVGLDSLKRFKDDAKEVREGFECGLKISGYDDVKVNDVIEAFKIEIKYRTL